MSLIQEPREDAASAGVAKATRLALRYPRQYLNPEESKAPAIAKMGRSGTVAFGPFRCRDKGDGLEVESKPHIPRLLGK